MRVLSMMSIMCTVSILLLTACQKKDHEFDTPPSDWDRRFMIDATLVNRAEIYTGSIAVNRGTDVAIRAYGARMVKEYQEAQKELEDMASKWGIHLPDEADSAHNAMAELLLTLQGHKFDTTYIHGQQIDHEVNLNMFNKELMWGEHVKMMAYAEKYQPYVVEHKRLADSIANKLD